MMEKIRQCQDNGVNLASFPTDLSKAFHCVPQDLLTAKSCASVQRKIP